jgi:hypothetical protein
MDRTDATVFYSWQSDLPPASNRSLIQAALEAAVKAIRADDTLHVVPRVERDTLGVAGAPDIGVTILRKDRGGRRLRLRPVVHQRHRQGGRSTCDAQPERPVRARLRVEQARLRARRARVQQRLRPRGGPSVRSAPEEGARLPVEPGGLHQSGASVGPGEGSRTRFAGDLLGRGAGCSSDGRFASCKCRGGCFGRCARCRGPGG